MAGRRNHQFYNTEDTLEGEDVAKQYFARQLYSRMVERGWNQSEMARRATAFLPKPAKGQKQGHAIGRDLISTYIRGRVLPRPTVLSAIAKALECKETDLMAPRSVKSATVPVTTEVVSFRSVGGDKAFIEIRKEVSMKIAMDIIKMIDAMPVPKP